MSSSAAKKHRMEICGDGFCAKMPLTRRLALAALIITGLSGQQRALFTAPQASAGHAAYQAHCASCHLVNLAGRNEAPPLAGSNFMNTWGARSTRELLTYIQTTMPPGSTGKLDQQTYLEIAASLLEANAALAGTHPIISTTNLTLPSIP